MNQRQRPRPARAGRGNTTAARVLIPGVVTVTAVVVLAAMVLAGCGGSAGAGRDVASGGSDKATATTAKKKDRQQSALEFARCMRENGVDMPDPKVGEDGLIVVGPGEGPTPGQEMQLNAEAEKACRPLLGEGLQDGPGTKPDPKEQERALEFARCMRDHGVNVPDPKFEGGGTAFEIGEGFDPSSPTFKEAQQACRQYFGPGGDGDPGVSKRSS
jgi:predicted small secreted protein